MVGGPMQLTDDEIRQLLLQPALRNRIRELMLSLGDDRILSWVAQGYGTSRTLSEVMDISVISASNRLSDLYGRGYLSRVEQQQDSGGYEWVYSL